MFGRGKKFRVNLQWQIIGLIAFGILSVAVLGSISAGIVVNNKVSNLVYRQAEQITNNFAKHSILPLLTQQGENALDDIKSTLAYENVQAVAIYTPDGHILIDSGVGTDNLLPLDSLDHNNNKPFAARLADETSTTWTFIAPVYDIDTINSNNADSVDTLFMQTSHLLGYVSIIIDRTSLFKTQKEILQNNLVTSLSLAIILFIIAVIAVSRMARPFYQLISLMKRAEDGQDDIKADVKGVVEIQSMSRAFNTMMQSLRQKRNDAEKQHNILLTEIDERIKAEEALKSSEAHLKTVLSQHEAIIATMPGIIIELDKYGKLLWWNKRFEKITGLDKSKISTVNIADIVSTQSATQTMAAIDQAISSGSCELHNKLLTTLGETPYQFNGVSLVDSEPENIKVLMVGMDNSESINAQIALEQARDAALDSSKIKSQFLANMSHEIRTPMNGMLGMLQLIADSKLNPEQRNFTEIALRSADQLLNTINDVLDFSKLEAGKLGLQKSVFSPRILIEDMVETFASKAHEKGLSIYADISFDIPAVILTDPYRLKQIVSNLLNNAVKFTDKGHIILKAFVSYNEIEGKKLHIHVIDTGIGIEEKFRSRIFDSFAQADGSSTRKYGGTGLGLAIVKQLTELLGGTLRFNSIHGEGSDFNISIPLVNIIAEEKYPVDLSKIDKDIVMYYIGSDEIQLSIFNEYARQLQTSIHFIPADKCHDFSPKYDVNNLFIIDGAVVTNINKLDAWGDILLSRLCILTNHFDSHDFDELLDEYPNLEKIFLPLGFINFAKLLQLQESDVSQYSKPDSTSDKKIFCSTDRILVAEDNDVNQRVLVAMLNKLGHAPLIARNGKEAIELLSENKQIDLIFMDCQMPVMDGFELTRHIREEGGSGQDIKIVAMTGNAMEGDQERCINAGMDDYISKPIRLSSLENSLNQWLPS